MNLSSTKVVQIMPLGLKLTRPGGSQFYIELYKENSVNGSTVTFNFFLR